MELLHKELTEEIIEACSRVDSELGYGFLEKVYEQSLAIELRDIGLKVGAQMPIKVFYRGNLIADYFADPCVEDLVIVEVKAVENPADIHEAQIPNYLKATPIQVGLLLDFGPKPKFPRKVFTNQNTICAHPLNPSNPRPMNGKDS